MTDMKTPRPSSIEFSRREGIAYLMRDGDLAVPAGRYGSTTRECAPIAWRVAYLVARETGATIDEQLLDHAMDLVVNSHEDVAYILNT